MKLTLSRLIAAITFLAIFAMATRVSFDTDTWWHLRTGAWIVEHGAVPMTDPFSHTRAGATWHIPGWIVQAPMYVLFNTFGYAGLNLFTAVCVTLTFAFVYQTCAGSPLLKAFVLVFAVASSAIYWSARPQIVSFLLAGAFVWILHDFRWQKRNRLWMLVPLMALWANAHGGFAIGFILLVLTTGGQVLSWAMRWWRTRQTGVAEPIAEGDVDWRGVVWLMGIGLACAAAVSLNPSGPEMLLYPFKTVSIGVLQDFIQEWQTPNFHMREAQVFLWVLFAGVAALGLSLRRANVTDLLLFSGTAYLGFLAGRNVAVFSLVAPALITRHLAWAWEEWRGRPLATTMRPGALPLNWAILVLVAVAALLKIALPLQTSVNEIEIAKMVPVGAANHIRQTQPPGKLFNAYNYGAYLTWALYPDYPVYVDGRTDLYNDEFLREYLRAILGQAGYSAVLDKYGINVVLVEPASFLGQRLEQNPAWRVTYLDAVAVVYQRIKPIPPE